MADHETRGEEPRDETRTPTPPTALRSARAQWLKRGLGLGLGAGAGFAYYFFVGCTSGGCPIWQDPVVSTGFGALLGSLIAW